MSFKFLRKISFLQASSETVHLGLKLFFQFSKIVSDQVSSSKARKEIERNVINVIVAISVLFIKNNIGYESFKLIQRDLFMSKNIISNINYLIQVQSTYQMQIKTALFVALCLSLIIFICESAAFSQAAFQNSQVLLQNSLQANMVQQTPNQCIVNCQSCTNAFSCVTCNTTNNQSCCNKYCSSCGADGVTCSACSQGFTLNSQNNVCVLNDSCFDNNCRPGQCGANSCLGCLPGYAFNPLVNYCTQCNISQCELCNFANVCETCNIGYYLNTTSKGAQSCQACMLGCSVCNSSATCQTCLSGFYAVSNTMCSACPQYCQNCSNGNSCIACFPGFYYNSRNSSCSQCSSNCVNCTNSPAICLTCYPGFYINIVNQCGTCSNSCRTCQGSANNCTGCSLGMVLLNVQVGGFYSCINCYQTVSGCYQCGLKNASSADSSYVCYSCLPGYYINKSVDIYGDDSPCVQCSPHCAYCNDNLTCQNCSIGYYLLANNTCVTCSSNCANCTADGCSICSQGFFLNSSASTVEQCFACALGCEQCLDSLAACTQCSPGFYLPYTNAGCLPCYPTCATCNNLLNCTSCIPGYGIVIFNNDSLCLSCGGNCQVCASGVCSVCMPGYYIGAVGQCSKCSTPGCSTCPGNTCSACNPSFFLSTITKNCVLCDQNCQSCNSTSTCGTCQTGFYLGANGSCLACPTGCINCGNNGNCLSCQNGLYLVVNHNECDKCPSPCNTCSGPSVSLCTSCDPQYYLSPNGTCQPCQQGCQICSTTSFCTFCSMNYGPNPNNSQTCASCTQNCAYCPQNVSVCQICTSGAVLDTNNTCFFCGDVVSSCMKCNQQKVCQQCQLGWLLNIVAGSCFQCGGSSTPGCSLCTNDELCLFCQQGYTFDQSNSKCKSNSGLSGWAIFGIIVGVLVLVGVIGGLVYYFFLRKKDLSPELVDTSSTGYVQLGRDY